jgi:hypothetical protein
LLVDAVQRDLMKLRALMTQGMCITLVKMIVQKENGEALLVMSAMIGTDYNRGPSANKPGVEGVGYEKARQLVKAMLRLHQQKMGSGCSTDEGFLDACCGMLAPGADDAELLSLVHKNDHNSGHNCGKGTLQKVRDHPHPFTEELQGVAAVFQRGCAQAAAVAESYTRESLLWTGRRLDARRYVDAMQAAGVEAADARSARPFFSRAITLEVERMARYGEACSSEALINVDSISKRREASLVQVRCCQPLLL